MQEKLRPSRKKKKTIENRGGRGRCASELCFFFFWSCCGQRKCGGWTAQACTPADDLQTASVVPVDPSRRCALVAAARGSSCNSSAAAAANNCKG